MRTLFGLVLLVGTANWAYTQELFQEGCLDGTCHQVDSDAEDIRRSPGPGVGGAPAQCQSGSGDCVELLQRRMSTFHSPRHNTSLASTFAGTPGTVAEVYTFGAPAVSRPAMPDNTQKDKCFRGLRTFTENKLPGGGRQTDAASMFDAYAHAIISTLALDWGQDSYYKACPGEVSWPKGGAADWGLHGETHYAPRLKEVTIEGKKVATQEPFAMANKMVTLAYKSYDTIANTKKEIAEKLPDWRLVDRHVFEWTSGAYDDDPILIAQNKKNLDCALVFTGTNTMGELGSSVKQHLTGYCGFDQVHAGYRDEVWQLSDHAIWKKVTEKLAKCQRVLCVGHSLGGAMCDVFSGCINSGHTNDPDYKKLMWYRGTPQLMPEIGSAEEEASLGAGPGGHGMGKIQALYTYGSPAVADPPLKDSKSANGCFNGLRIYSENDLAGGGKQVDAYTFHDNYFPHPKMNVLSLQWNKKSHFDTCSNKDSDSVRWPHHNGLAYSDWSQHTVQGYWDRLEQLAQKVPNDAKKLPNNQLLEEAKKFVHFAWSAELPKQVVLSNLKQYMPGWKLVAREPLKDEKEPVLLAQDSKTFDCALVMPGNGAVTSKTYGTEFCGLKNVHHGYRNYFVESVQTPNWHKVAELLPKCRNVMCLGHSRGGSMCELLAACINDGKIDDQDYRRIMWTDEPPAALPAIS